MKIYFDVTEQSINDMSVADYEAFERAQDGEIKLYRLRPAICRFMVDEQGTPVPYERALKISSQFKVPEVKEFLEKFFAVVSDRTVPKGSGSPSELPSEVQQADSAFPAG